MIDKIYTNFPDATPTVYDQEEFTVLRLVSKLTSKVNEIIDTIDDNNNVLRNEVYVDEYDTPALAIAALSDGGILRINKPLTITSEITCTKNIRIIGCGEYSIVKIADMNRITSMFYFIGVKHVKIENVVFDMNGQNMPLYSVADYPLGSFNKAVYCNLVSGTINIQDCEFRNVYNGGIFLYNCSAKININRNKFTSFKQLQGLRGEHIGLQTCSGNQPVDISYNSFINEQPIAMGFGVSGISMDGLKSKTSIHHNTFDWCGRINTYSHRLLAIDMYGNCNNIEIRDNLMTNCISGFLRCESSQNVKFCDNDCYMAENGGEGNPAIWVVAGTMYPQTVKDILIEGNNFYIPYAASFYDIIGVWTLDWSKTCQNIDIIGNSLYGYSDRFISVTAGFDTINVIGNKSYTYDSHEAKTMVYLRRWGSVEPVGTETLSISIGLTVKNNTWKSSASGVVGVLTSYTGTISDVVIENNNIRGVSATGQNIRLTDVPAVIRNNVLSESSEGLYADGAAFVYFLNNICYDMSDSIAYALGAGTPAVAEDNYLDTVLVV